MPPSKIGCQILATNLKAKGATLRIIADVRSKLREASLLKSALRYGKNSLDTLSAEVITTIASVSARATKSVFASASAMASNALELVLKKVLEILLAAPTAIFSFVAIPHKEAKRVTSEEYRFLSRAYSNIRNIVSIILKWVDGKSSEEYYNQIKDALPHIKDALISLAKLIRGLEADDGDMPSRRNAVFDESAYNSVKSSLEAAIFITKPSSELSDKINLANIFESEKNKLYSEKEKKINKEYERRMSNEGEDYKNKLSSYVSTDSDSIANKLKRATYEHALIIEHDSKVEVIDLWRKEMLDAANIESEVEAHSKTDALVAGAMSLTEKFNADMKRLTLELSSLVKNIGRAYSRYQESQLLCNNIYHSRTLITRLVEMCISMLRKTGNVAADTVIDSTLDTAESLIEVVEEDFEEVIKRYEESSYDVSSSELSLKVFTGHEALLGADAYLSSNITESLIDLINADDILDDTNQDFNEFIGRLESIPDWDDQLGVWSVSIEDSAISPYISAVAESVEMLAKIPSLALSGKEKDKRRVSILSRNSLRSIKRLLTHNSFVQQILNSYQPYVASQAGDLMRILSSAGLLKEFAMTMSILSLAKRIGVDEESTFNLDEVNYTNCAREYFDMFDDDDITKSATNDKLSVRDPNIAIPSNNEKAEESELPLREVLLSKKTYDISKTLSDEDMRTSDEELSGSYPKRNDGLTPTSASQF